MKIFSLLSLGLAAVTSAQASSSSYLGNTTVSTSTHSTSTATHPLTPEQTCLAACAQADICCQAACVKVPCPDQAQVNATTQCAAECPQGNGTAGETAEYASCQSSCISSLFLTTATSETSFSSAPTNSAGSTTGEVVAASASISSGAATRTSGSSGSSTTASATGSSASSTSTGAASNLQLRVTTAGVLGLLVMGLAL